MGERLTSDTERTAVLDAAFFRDEVRDIALALIREASEGEKVDFKSELFPVPGDGTTKDEANADLLRHLSAFANTNSQRLTDHGFLIFGAERGSLVGIEHTERDPDKLSNHIEQLVEDYLMPMVRVEIHRYDTEGLQWGVVLVSPSNLKPHVVSRGLKCRDPKKSLRDGDWYVRRGARTVRAGPEDYVRVLRESVEGAVAPLRSDLDRLHAKYQSLSDRYESRVVDLLGRALSGGAPSPGDADSARGELEDLAGVDLATRLRRRLAGPFEHESREVLGIALELRAFLDSTDEELPWDFGSGEAQAELKAVERLEQRVLPLLEVLATVVAYDTKGALDDAVTQVVKTLAKKPYPQGTFTDAGVALRLYPLFLVLNTLFVVGVPLARSRLLRRCLDQEIVSPLTREADHIGSSGFLVSTMNNALRRATGLDRCAIANIRARDLVSSIVHPILVGAERTIYYVGEFVLGLAGIEARGVEDDWTVPGPGTYLYNSDARAELMAFLRSRPEWLEDFYRHPIDTVLKEFDRTARLAVDQRCFASGFSSGAFDAYDHGKVKGQ